MAEVLCVYQEVAVLRAEAGAASNVALISYDEKPGIQAIANVAPDLPPMAGKRAGFTRDHEYKRHGTLSPLAGIDLLRGEVHACVEDRHRSREFVAFLKKLDSAYPADTAIKIILDTTLRGAAMATILVLTRRPYNIWRRHANPPQQVGFMEPLD